MDTHVSNAAATVAKSPPHSAHTARQDFFSRTDPAGLDVAGRARARVVRGWSTIGENIAYNRGFDDPAAFAVERWMKSAKHRSNALNPEYTRTGVGAATWSCSGDALIKKPGGGSPGVCVAAPTTCPRPMSGEAQTRSAYYRAGGAFRDVYVWRDEVCIAARSPRVASSQPAGRGSTVVTLTVQEITRPSQGAGARRGDIFTPGAAEFIGAVQASRTFRNVIE